MVARNSKGQWKRGHSGNPDGRPARRAFTDELTRQLDDTGAVEDIVRRVIERALQGERWAVELIWIRLEGKPRQAINVGAIDEDFVFTLNFNKNPREDAASG